MLGKLFKHEFISCSRLMGPSYLIVLVLALLGRFFTWLTTRKFVEDSLNPAFIKVIYKLADVVTILFVVAFITLVILTVVFMIYRFYKNFFTDQGYLMLTLPTTPSVLVLSKLLNSMVWFLFSLVIALGSIFIALGSSEVLDELKTMWDTFGQVMTTNPDYVSNELGTSVPVFVVELVIFAVIYATRFMANWYFSVAFGQLLSKNHKILGTVLAYLILEVAAYIFTLVFTAITSSVLPDLFPSIAESSGTAMQATLISNMVQLLLGAAILYFITCRIMSRRLNLD